MTKMTLWVLKQIKKSCSNLLLSIHHLSLDPDQLDEEL